MTERSPVFAAIITGLIYFSTREESRATGIFFNFISSWGFFAELIIFSMCLFENPLICSSLYGKSKSFEKSIIHCQSNISDKLKRFLG